MNQLKPSLLAIHGQRSGAFNPFSASRAPEFGMDYGTLIVEHARMGLLVRTVVVLDENNVAKHRQRLPELTHEPDDAVALVALG